MLTRTQLTTMLTLQDQMNAKINPNWLNAGNEWHRAIMVESVEGIEHHGWKWWKKQDLDMAQLQMELVDIWHFALSHILVCAGGSIEDAADDVFAESELTHLRFDEQFYEFGDRLLIEKLELMTGLAAAKRFSVPLFFSIMEECGMSHDELYRQYIGKNVLNFFRQDNGYKAGTYAKIWEGREDNEHLVEIMNALDMDSPTFGDDVYQGLAARYPG